jgi:DNA-directed RNA polymerase beta subunit
MEERRPAIRTGGDRRRAGVVTADTADSSNRRGHSAIAPGSSGTCINQRPIVVRAPRRKAGDAAGLDEDGELASDVLWRSRAGRSNYEDAIVISEKLVDDLFTSTSKHEI